MKSLKSVMVIERGEKEHTMESSTTRRSQDGTKRHILSQIQFKGGLMYDILPPAVALEAVATLSEEQELLELELEQLHSHAKELKQEVEAIWKNNSFAACES